MEARIIGPASELGQFDSLNFYGNSLTREFGEITVSPEQLVKLQGNRYVEIKGQPKAQEIDVEAAEGAKRESDQEAAIRARLDELGVEHDGRASLKTLQGKLDAAEKAKAKADAEAADALAEAQAQLDQA